MTASDPTSTWTSRSANLSGASTVVRYFDGVWGVISDNKRLSTSSDGLTWTTRTPAVTSNSSRLYGFGNGIFLYGAQKQLSWATDAKGTWTLYAVDPFATNCEGVDYNGTYFIAVCQTGNLYKGEF